MDSEEHELERQAVERMFLGGGQMGARMRDMYPVVPLAHGQAVAIGVTSYDGTVCYGLNADRDALPDVDTLAAAIDDSLAELKEAPAAEAERTSG